MNKADGYNAREGYDRIARERETIRKRSESRIIHLRQFDNWIKSALIDRFCPGPNATILDLACGKGGDIKKMKLKKPSKIVFADISPESLNSLYDRHNKELYDMQCDFMMLEGDVFAIDINPFLEDVYFHFVSCQFALHYAFIDEKTANTAISNICQHLMPGGHAVITTLDACRIVHQFKDQAKKASNQEQKDTVHNSVFKMVRKFEVDSEIPPFGAKYIFYLDNVVNGIPEYLVHPQVLEDLFNKYECDLIESFAFDEYYDYCMKNDPSMKNLFYDLLKILAAIENSAMTEDEWYVCRLYKFYVFKKRGTPEPLPEAIKNNSSYRDYIRIDVSMGKNISKYRNR